MTYVPRAYACGPKKPAKIDGNDDIRDASDVGVALEFQAHVWPLLMEHRVTAVFSGHNHGTSGTARSTRRARVPGSIPTRDCIRALIPARMRTTRRDRSTESLAVSHTIWARDGPGSTQVPGSGPGSWVYDRPRRRYPSSSARRAQASRRTRRSGYRRVETCGYCEAVMYEFGYLRVAALNDTHLRFEFSWRRRGRRRRVGPILHHASATVGGGMVEKGEGDGAVWWHVAGGCAMVAVAVAAFVVIRRKDIASSYAQLEEKEVQMRGIHGGAIDDV